MKRRVKRLALSKETLLLLGTLRAAQGGTGTAKTCDVPCVTNTDPSDGTVCSACTCDTWCC